MVRTYLRERGPTPVDVVRAALAGLGGVLGSYAVAGLSPGFVAAPIGGFLSRRLPSVVVNLAILVLGELGQQLNLATAIGLAVGLLAVAALAGIAVARRTDRSAAGLAVAGGLSWLVAVGLTGAPAAALGAAVGTVIVLAVGAVAGAIGGTYRDPDSTERRRVLASLASAVGIGVFGYLSSLDGTAFFGGSGARPNAGSTARTPDPGDVVGDQAEIDALLAEADEKSLGVDGIEPLVSEDFYEVDINPVNPTVDREEWSLSVTGAVESEFELTDEDLRELEFEHRFVTLRCVGEPLNGQKMDTALWTGVPAQTLLDRAGPTSDCDCVMLRAADDYFVQFPLEAFRDGLLAYQMNGRPLPGGHGYPLRALVPGHWGEVNTKWLTEIELLEDATDGYWEQRGWHGTGPVETVAKLHAINRLGDGRVEVAGHAYAGTRGIQTVHVSTDGGNTWTKATLSEPLPGDDVWRQWRYEYDAPDQRHEVVVYAVDGTGREQPREQSGSFPDGPSGWVREAVRGR
jgi:DMSO/TMAO reductase YedYZ molybdopterin-dependent catalytic subunit